MSKWITNWPHGGKWGSCSAAMAAQIAVEGRCQVMLIADAVPITRYILRTPPWAQTLKQRSPAVAMALKLSPLDQFRAQTAERRRMVA